VIGGAVIGTALALTGVQNHLVEYLGLLGTFIPPLGGVIIGDFLAHWRRGIPAGTTPPAVRWPNLLAYAAAAVLAWLSGELGVGIPPVIGIVVAIALSMGLSRVGSPTTPVGAGRGAA
jgi:cytosine permease